MHLLIDLEHCTSRSSGALVLILGEQRSTRHGQLQFAIKVQLDGAHAINLDRLRSRHAVCFLFLLWVDDDLLNASLGLVNDGLIEFGA